MNNIYTGPEKQLLAKNPVHKKVYRSRQPVMNDQGVIGYLDFWSPSQERALEQASLSPDRIFQVIFEQDIPLLPIRSQALAYKAMSNAYPD